MSLKYEPASEPLLISNPQPATQQRGGGALSQCVRVVHLSRHKWPGGLVNWHLLSSHNPQRATQQRGGQGALSQYGSVPPAQVRPI